MATLGYTTVGGTNGLNTRPIGCKFTSTEAGSITQMTATIASTGTANYKFVIYSDNSGSPDVLLATSAADTYNTSYTAKTLPISYDFIAAQTLWLGMISDDNIRFKYDAGSTSQFKAFGPDYTYPTPNDPAGTVFQTEDWVMSIYVTYTPSVAITPTIAWLTA